MARNSSPVENDLGLELQGIREWEFPSDYCLSDAWRR